LQRALVTSSSAVAINGDNPIWQTLGGPTKQVVVPGVTMVTQLANSNTNLDLDFAVKDTNYYAKFLPTTTVATTIPTTTIAATTIVATSTPTTTIPQSSSGNSTLWIVVGIVVVMVIIAAGASMMMKKKKPTTSS
jgi:hypothetical protein